jgi:CCR4-NOT transcriptional complex subunit CAF120
VGAALTEREREKRLAEERQRKLDELQRQQLEQMQQGGSLYGQQLAGFNPMMNPMNPMMMGVNPMMPSFMGYPGMMPNFGNPQHMFAAQQAAQAYQQAMVSLSQAGSQIGGEGGTPAPMSLMMTGAGMAPSPAPINPMMTGGGMGGASPAPLSPMMTGGGMGAFDPRFSMMSMSMMNPMAMGMGMGMGMGNPGMVGAPMGMGVPMNTGAGFDPRMSQFDPGQVANSNFIQSGRPGSTLGLEPSPGDGTRRSANASPRPPQ